MKIALAQINPVIADIMGNQEKIISFINKAEDAGADLIIFPEMATVGYPPMDLLESGKLIDDNIRSIEAIASCSKKISVICGFIGRDDDNPPLLLNSAAFITGGKIHAVINKTLLPTYDVFDELRYFSPAASNDPILFMEKKIGITICEDIWNIETLGNPFLMEMRGYKIDILKNLVSSGADLMVNISASPFVRGKHRSRIDMLSAAARKHGVPIVYVNQCGGNDSLVFDGSSFAVDKSGRMTAHAESFREDLKIFDTDNSPAIDYAFDSDIEEIRKTLALGLSDYVKKCGFKKVLVGLSGGIDSALTATLAVQALGPENVMGITMPSKFSSKGSVDDSLKLAENLGIRIETISITGLYDEYRSSLSDIFKGYDEDVTEENIQARIRGNILMAASNKFGALLLTTGNKSELATGYCTLYGDMSGGLAVISDLPKTMVYEMSEHINRDEEIIPRATIEKTPSAELRENQTDQDSLPPYNILDGILELYIEKRKSAEEIVLAGYDEQTVADILKKINLNEYKRLQAAPGIKVTSKSFGFGRRIPIANKFVP